MTGKTVQNYLGVLLARTHRQMTSLWSTESKPVGLTLDMWVVLGELAEKPGQSMTTLAGALSHNLPTVTKLIDRMVSDNLVYRKPHHKDRRRVLIFPTARGIELYHEASAIADQMEDRLAHHLKSIGKLKSMLAKLTDFQD